MCLKYCQEDQKNTQGIEIGTPHARSCKQSMCYRLHLRLIIKTSCFFSTLFLCVGVMTHTGMYVHSSARTQTCVYVLQIWGFKHVESQVC